MAAFQITRISLITGGPLVFRAHEKSQCEWMNREADVIMTYWVCTRRGGGLDHSMSMQLCLSLRSFFLSSILVCISCTA